MKRAKTTRRPASYRYRCRVRVGRRTRWVEFRAKSDQAAIRYCRGLMLTRLPDGAEPVALERMGAGRARRSKKKR